MDTYKTLGEISEALRPYADLAPGFQLKEGKELSDQLLDRLTYTAAFGAEKVRDVARGVVMQAAAANGTWLASIHDLYMARGAGQCSGFTVPAINIRGLTYDTARAVFRAAKTHDVGTVILEIAGSEIGYTEQRPAEYAAVVTAAALRERFTGPLFLQGDHFQFNAKKYAVDPEAETKAVLDLTKEAIQAGFMNIDIDTSTLVDLSHATVEDQQRVNFERAAQCTATIRKLEPEGVTTSVGAEIGGVGKKN